MPLIYSIAKSYKKHTIIFLIIASIFGGIFYSSSMAASIDDLRDNISNKKMEVVDLEKEIVRLDSEIKDAVNEAGTLKGEIKLIDNNRKKLDTKIKLTNSQINLAALNIEELEKEIGTKKEKIVSGKETIAGSLKIINEKKSDSIVQFFFSENSVSEFMYEIDQLGELQKAILDNLTDLKKAKNELETNKTKLDKEKKKLLALKSQLIDEKKIADQNKQEKDRLLNLTKNKESNYKKLLGETIRRREAVEKEILSYEAELQVAIDPNSLPAIGSKILNWPLTKIYITQYFGNTSFAKQNAQAYNGLGHNGVDLRASVGTPVFAALGGKVVGTGDTDLTCRGASYGRWVLIDHNNGLSTLYAHLSLIKVSADQEIGTKDLIAYSGNTGYATGPHLHFSVFATKGVGIMNLKSKVPGCGIYTMPRASFNAYLNPLSYL